MKHWRRYLIVAGFIVLLVIVQFRNPDAAGPYKGVMGNVLNPFVYIVNRTGVFFSSIWQNYIWLVGVSKENEDLQEKLNYYQFENTQLLEKLKQFQSLEKLMDFRDTYEFDTITANIIGRNTDGYMKTVIIDRGSVDGISVNDSVVSFTGLVGKVNRVYRGSSEVMLLYHHDSGVSVINSRTRAVGVLKGDGYGGLYVDYYDRLDDARVGDSFITSGMGQLFPKGILCGEIAEVTTPPTGLFQMLKVNCSVDFYKLEHVLVIKSRENGESEESAEPAAAQELQSAEN